jgi:hypothetical protein
MWTLFVPSSHGLLTAKLQKGVSPPSLEKQPPFFFEKQRSTVIFYETETGNSDFESMTDDLSAQFTSPVMQQLAPQLLAWKEEYGHPNIPLKNPGGSQCQTLRRLHIQNKLTEKEVEWLSDIGFIFHSMEDVYKYADFDEMFDRLLNYEESHPGSNFQIPKKCPEDPELGAWVTGIRRLGKDGVNPAHERRLESIGFVWVSTRKCGSKFMSKYRELAEQIDEKGLEEVMADPKTVSWIQAQQEALKRNGLSQTRVHYMGNMFGDQWTTIGKENILGQ